MAYEEFADWKIHGYVLPSSIFGVIRTECLDTGKIEEFTYQTQKPRKEETTKRDEEEQGRNPCNDGRSISP